MSEKAATTVRAEHVGSLLRPQELLDTRAAGVPLDELRALEDAAILDALRLQREAGIEVLTDGELRRESWLAYWWQSVDGMVELEEPPFKIEWHEIPDDSIRQDDLQLRPIAVGGKLRRKVPSLPEVEADFLLANAGGPFKVAMASPTMTATLWIPGVSSEAYTDPGEMVRDAVAAQVEEVESLVDRGVTWLQLDSLRYTSMIDDNMRRRMEGIGIDVERAFDETIATDNEVIAAARRRNPDVTVGVHFCRGNNRSAWAASGGYEPVAERLFGEVDADRFLLEYDTDRSGGFEPLRFVPRGKTVVLGLVSSKTPELEPPDELRRRIDEASRYVPLDDLALSPQCGFASTAAGNLLTPDEQRRKLELVVEIAAAVWR
jgi:5-methyltetrahydropteroyltriglutamate--homocysteine methyltransferase